MKRRFWGLIAALAVIGSGGCAREQAAPPAVTVSATRLPGGSVAEAPKQGAHKTAHGGVLNAICKCEIGHAEVKPEGDTLWVWFVGGAPDTTRAVPIPERSISLKITTPGTKTAKTLVLQPDPLDLAGEKVGSCSRFEGRASWLQGITAFTGTATVRFKGQPQPLRIEYPNGYDPD